MLPCGLTLVEFEDIVCLKYVKLIAAVCELSCISLPFLLILLTYVTRGLLGLTLNLEVKEVGVNLFHKSDVAV